MRSERLAANATGGQSRYRPLDEREAVTKLGNEFVAWIKR
jgi:hypothetical protein